MTPIEIGGLRPVNHDFGIVEALPTQNLAPGCTCTFKAATGIYWKLVYTGETTYPWAKIGGPPLRFVDPEGRSCESTTNLSTGVPSMTAPLAMEALFTFGASYIQNSSGELNEALLVLLINGVESEFARWTSSSTFALTAEMVDSVQAIAKGQVATLRYRGTSAKKLVFNRNQFKVDPLRVG